MARIDTVKEITWTVETAADGAAFWAKLGPLATAAAVAKEMGSGIVSSDRHTWLFAMDGEEVVAMGALVAPKKAGEPVWLDMAYVRPEYRREGLWTAMYERRMAMAAREGYARVRACTRVLGARLAADGFTVYRQAGSWAYMEKVI